MPGIHRIGGIIPVLFSFFDERGAIRLDAFDHQIDHCLENGATGIVLFGFVTQFYRLSFSEKVAITERCARRLGGRGMLGLTVMEPTPEGQQDLIRLGEDNGVDWIILQPPLGPPPGGRRWLPLIRHLASSTSLAVAVQNAAMTGSTLSIDDLVALQEACPNVRYVKAETDMLDIADFATRHGSNFGVITGNWGIDYPFQRLQGAHGLIPAPSFVREQVAIHNSFEPGGGGIEAALPIQERILPLMQFFRERSIDEQLLLAKYVFAQRTGLDLGGERLPASGPLDRRMVEYANRLTQRLDG
jgi:dihydrodipicolinate synthase/N-acetylneuraminate lyase